MIRIESTEDHEYLFSGILLQKFSILKNGEETTPTNGRHCVYFMRQETDSGLAIEKAIDLHATRVIGSSGYQKVCIVIA